MSLTTGEMSAADLAAVVGNGNNGGMWGGDGSWWIILLFLCLFNGGWNNGYGGGNGANGFVPYYLANNTDAGVQRGFDTAALSGQLSGINSAITNGFASAEIAGCNRAMADMERSFASQTAITNGLTNLSSQLATCCCENRAATNDLKYTIATEACASRATSTDNTRAILDKLCQLELDGKNDRIADLERQLTMANLSASQTAQTAQILADNNRQTVALEQYLNPVPVPAYVVANPNCCNQNTGCGCGF